MNSVLINGYHFIYEYNIHPLVNFTPVSCILVCRNNGTILFVQEMTLSTFLGHVSGVSHGGPPRWNEMDRGGHEHWWEIYSAH